MPALVIKENKPREGGKPLYVVIGAKTAKKATERNLIKRRIRAIMSPLVKNTKKTYVVIVKPEAKHLTHEELKTELTNQWRNFFTL